MSEIDLPKVTHYRDLHKAMDRPHTTVVLAMSADGKIGDAMRNAVNFGSKVDYAHLEKQVAIADGVLFGAGTLRSGGTAMRVQSQALIDQRIAQGNPPQPVQIVCTRSGQIDPGLKFFKQPIPRWLLTTSNGALGWQDTPNFDQVLNYSDPANDSELDWPRFFQSCLAAGIEKLAVLGGGEVIGALLEGDYLDELQLTLCPLLLGGRTAPSPADGIGISQDLAPRLLLKSCQQVDHELFLHYVVQR